MRSGRLDATHQKFSRGQARHARLCCARPALNLIKDIPTFNSSLRQATPQTLDAAQDISQRILGSEDMADYGVQAVAQFGELLQQMLRKADEVKPTYTIEPPIDKSDLRDIFERVNVVFPPPDVVVEVKEGETMEEKEQRATREKKRDLKKRNQYAIIETAVRDTFNNLLVSSVLEESREYV
jgi:DNA-directed RNA polymerase subunit L